MGEKSHSQLNMRRKTKLILESSSTKNEDLLNVATRGPTMKENIKRPKFIRFEYWTKMGCFGLGLPI